MTVLAVVQARLGSGRLPRKALATLAGRPTLAHVMERAMRLKRIDHLVLATTTQPEDDELEGWAKNEGISVFRGSENNVVERLLGAAREYRASHLARITADCPLLDPELCDQVIEIGITQKADFACNYVPATFPDGLDFGFLAVETLYKLSTSELSPFDAEHVTTYFERNWNHNLMVNLSSHVDLSGHRWTLDNPQDHIFLDKLLGLVSKNKAGFSYHATLEILRLNQELLELQSNEPRNQGHNLLEHPTRD